MKQSVINLEAFYDELRASGIPATLDYNEDEEAYVLNVGEPVIDGVSNSKPTLQIAPGFLYERLSGKNTVIPEILAYTDRVMIFAPDGNPATPESANDKVVFDKLNKVLRGDCEQIVYSIH